MSNDDRTFLDDILDKAEEVVSTVERFAEGSRGILPMEFDDGSRIIADAMAGGMDSTEGEPNWITLRFFDKNGKDWTRRYRRESSPTEAKVINIGGGK